MALDTQQQLLVEQRLANDKKSTAVAYVLWFFLSGFGAHRFYAGKIGSAVVMMLLFWIGAFTAVFFVGLLLLGVFGIWWIIDGFLIPGWIATDMQAKRAQIASELGLGTPAE